MMKVNFDVPTWCVFANKFIWGLDKTGYTCKGVTIRTLPSLTTRLRPYLLASVYCVGKEDRVQ